MSNSSTSTRRQTTVRVNGKRIRLVTTAAGTTAAPAPIEEWRLQAEAVRQLRAMPEYVKTPADVEANAARGLQSFTLAADFNAGKRDASKAKATGVMAGETDLRVYASGARLLLPEYKNAEGRLSREQKDRHALLRALGYRVEVIKAATPEECAAASVALVRGWLATSAIADNDNQRNDNQPLLDANARVASYGSSGAVCGSGAARHKM